MCRFAWPAILPLIDSSQLIITTQPVGRVITRHVHPEIFQSVQTHLDSNPYSSPNVDPEETHSRTPQGSADWSGVMFALSFFFPYAALLFLGLVDLVIRIQVSRGVFFGLFVASLIGVIGSLIVSRQPIAVRICLLLGALIAYPIAFILFAIALALVFGIEAG